MVSSTDVCSKNMVQHTLPAGEYIVCKIEAESFEELVTTALNQAVVTSSSKIGYKAIHGRKILQRKCRD